jgi:IS66 Orf2 like protein
MFGLGPATKIYISLDAVDMRKGFDGLYGLVRDHLGQDPQGCGQFPADAGTLFPNALRRLLTSGSEKFDNPRPPPGRTSKTDPLFNRLRHIIAAAHSARNRVATPAML